MDNEPRPDATDPEAPTERHELSGAEPSQPSAYVVASGTTGASTPDVGIAEAAATDGTREGVTADAGVTAAPALDRYAPTPEPRADWARDWNPPLAPTPERWYEPAPSTEPVRATTAPRSRAGAGSLVVVSLLSAVLASGGTVLA